MFVIFLSIYLREKLGAYPDTRFLLQALTHFNMATFFGDGDPACNPSNWPQSHAPSAFAPSQVFRPCSHRIALCACPCVCRFLLRVLCFRRLVPSSWCMPTVWSYHATCCSRFTDSWTQTTGCSLTLHSVRRRPSLPLSMAAGLRSGRPR